MSTPPVRNLKELSDAELIALYRGSSDKTLVGELFKRYSHLIYGLCITYFRDKDEAKDAVLRIFEGLFDKLKGNEVNHFRNWLTIVAKNHCISTIRSAKVRDKHETRFSKEEKTLVENEPDQRQHREDKEIQLNRLETAIGELKHEQKTCIILFFMQERSYAEIAEITGFSMMEVKSHLQNGKRNLKLILTKQNANIPS